MPEDRLGGDPKAAKPSETTADNRGRKYGHATHTDYFAQQAAIQSFVAAGLLVGVVAQQVGAEKAREIQRQAAEAADGLFGQVRGTSRFVTRTALSRTNHEHVFRRLS